MSRSCRGAMIRNFSANLKRSIWAGSTSRYRCGCRLQKGNVLLRLEGVSTVEEAEKLRGHILYMDRDEVELEEGVYFIQDLIGLEVLDADTGASYGKLTDVLQTVPTMCTRCGTNPERPS